MGALAATMKVGERVRKMEVLLGSALLEVIMEWKVIKIIRLCRVRESFAFPQNFRISVGNLVCEVGDSTRS